MKTILKSLSALSLAAVASVLALNVATAQTIPGPVFNNHSDVSGIGDESDFLRFGTDGSGGNTIEACEDGQVIDLWMYVHNGASAFNNGENYDGASVAHNTVLDLDVNTNSFANSHTLSASIDSDETSPITDTVTITCGDREVALEYLGQSDFATTDTTGNYGIVGDVINGASIGYEGGVVPGCWEYRARVNAQVKVIVKEEPKEEANFACTLLDVVPVSGKTSTVAMTINYTATPADRVSLVSSSIVITGPNSYETILEGTNFPEVMLPEVAGTYTATATLTFNVDGESKEVTCKAQVVVEEEPETPEKPEDPKTPPVTTITRTGAGTNIALFAVSATIGTLVYRVVASRR